MKNNIFISIRTTDFGESLITAPFSLIDYMARSVRCLMMRVNRKF